MMRYPVVLKFLGMLCFFLGLCMLPCAACEFFYGRHFVPLMGSSAITWLVGGALFFAFRQAKTTQLYLREGVGIVVLGWILVGIMGALPFYFSDFFDTFIDALFESVSGFTTTGSSILTDVEALSHGLLLWRSMIQWLGGMGIIVLSIAILPFLGIGGMQLFKAEVPSPSPDKLRPRIRDTAKILWKIYIVFTGCELLLLWIGGMSFFDSLCHAFTTMPTGGFSTKTASIAHFDSWYIEVVILVFMLMAGVNFSLHYQFFSGKSLAFWRDSECRFFLFLVLSLIVIVCLDLFIHGDRNIGHAIRVGSFQVISILTTTGYATADYALWPGMSQILLLVCMFAGACAGSTGGGMKLIRIILCIKFCYRELLSLIHPRGVYRVKNNGRRVSETILRSILGFLALYVGLFVLCSVSLAAMGLDQITSTSAVASCLGNIGPAFGMVGPTENYALLPQAAKWLLTGCMILGRLEIYTLIMIVVPEFWRK